METHCESEALFYNLQSQHKARNGIVNCVKHIYIVYIKNLQTDLSE